MLSRVANSIYWLNRYVERAENVARFIDVNLNLLLDSPGVIQQWQPIVITTGDLPLFQERYGEVTEENVIQFLTFDRDYPNSIISCLRLARENARSIREIISSEMWEQVNSFYLMVKDVANSGLKTSELPEFFEKVKMDGHLFSGIMDATMSHNEAWHFGRMGRFLERSDKTSRILDVKYYILLPSIKDIGTPLDEVQWMALLKSASAYEMYRKRQQHRITPNGVVEFLILDREFPRSIQYCLSATQRSLYEIIGVTQGMKKHPVEKVLGRLCSELDYLTIEEIIQTGLHEFLDNLQTIINQTGEKIFETFFDLQPIEAQRLNN
ncbi:MAG: alpha-E domain-containing protein [Okeania sp. SIO2C9]|uniref:alpha-E domain-containing protein n=1 Tax=Okeania sp. SIO2C9 TaxID=2607791 RepID=UPI0013C14B89|nr:alpha-E domain-containing protein [Okeania sp. SIO2C9]NEQ75077.1 alpha-E domain-containing protein [Okeania sp. SIO2C9]